MHHTIDAHIAAARVLHAGGERDLRAWGHDHDGACRGFPAKHTEIMYVVVLTKAGPVLFRHNALNFGARGSVWAFGRLSDALVTVARLLLFLPVFHFVDDFTGIEASSVADSGFEAFADINEAFGFSMTESKKQPPTSELKDLGVTLALDADGVRIKAWPNRVKTQTLALQKARADDKLMPALAGRLAGKGSHLATAIHGKIGRAALKEFFRRQHAAGRNFKLTRSLRAACASLETLYACAPPRFMPYKVPLNQTPVIFVDACPGRRNKVPHQEGPPRGR